MRRNIASVGLSLLLLSACTSSGGLDNRALEDPSSAPEDVRTPVVVDTDMGQDDMMALLFLLQRPDVRVDAITVTGTGLAHCDPGVGIALSLLDVAGADDVPVACGPEQPLPGEHRAVNAFPDEWREATDDAYGIELAPSDRRPSDLAAPELLRAAAASAGAPVRLITLGPLTNVALALRDDPSFAHDLENVTIMGGALDVPGNVLENAVAEFNIWVDPVAAREVFASGAGLTTLVPLDATNQVPVTAFFADALARHHDTPEAETVNALFEAQPWLPGGDYYFWDPLAAALVVEPALATVGERTIDVVEGERETLGQTVDGPPGEPIRVVVGADALAFEEEFLATLNGGTAVGPMRPDPVAAIVMDEGGCAYDGPTRFSPGLAAVMVANQSSTPWNAILIAIDPGHTYGEFERAVRAFEQADEPPSWVVLTAESPRNPGAGELSPWELDGGTYGLICQRDEPFTLEPVAEIVAG